MKKTFIIFSLLSLSSTGAWASADGVNIVPDNIGLQIWVVLTFLFMFVLLAKFAFKPITEALDKRGKDIKDSLEQAQKTREEAKKSMEEYQQQLSQARSEAGKIVDEARVLGENVRKEMMEKANTESSALIQRAQEEIMRQQEKGLQELKDTVASMSVQIASQVIEKEVNESTHRQLVDNLIRDLSKVSAA